MQVGCCRYLKGLHSAVEAPWQFLRRFRWDCDQSQGAARLRGWKKSASFNGKGWFAVNTDPVCDFLYIFKFLSCISPDFTYESTEYSISSLARPLTIEASEKAAVLLFIMQRSGGDPGAINTLSICDYPLPSSVLIDVHQSLIQSKTVQENGFRDCSKG